MTNSDKIQGSTVDQLFAYIIPRKSKFILLFQLLYFLQVALFLWSSISFYSGSNSGLNYQLGVLFGKISVIQFIIVLIPGMMKRFGISHKILALIMIFRRYIGISMYLLVLSHFGLVKVVPNIKVVKLPVLSLFEIWGSMALLILLILFITSNDYSVKCLRVWWYRLHRLIYLAMWFILFHLGFQRIGIWTILMGIMVILMSASFIYHFYSGLRSGSKPH